MKDILVDAEFPDGKERQPLLVENALFCEWHPSLSLVWDCYCDRRVEVEVRVYPR